MKKHKKIFYVPGLISALIIPILFIYYAEPTYRKMNLRVLDIGLPYKLKKGENTNDHQYAIIPKEGWNYKQIQLKSQITDVDEKYYFDLIKNLQKADADKTGIQFKFSKNSTYGDFVKLMNLMLKTKQETWSLDTEKDNSLYMVYFKINADDKVFGNDVVLTNINDCIDNQDFITKLAFYSPKESIYLLFSFLILIYIAMLKPQLKIEI